MNAGFHYQGEGWYLRQATPADNEALCKLFQSIHLPASLELTQERDPDFFAMLRMHSGAYHAFTGLSDEGEVSGCASMPRRLAWDGDRRVESAYLCDLRIVPRFRSRGALGLAFDAFLEFVAKDYGAELFTTVIFDTNDRAKKALVGKKTTEAAVGNRRLQPMYREMTKFHMTSVHFTTNKPAPSRPVNEASSSDRDELFQFLIDGQRRRLLGECLDEEILNRRLATWPGFSLSDFLIARNRQGKIAGCLAPWDTGVYKRTRVIGYHGSMAWVRRGFDLMARLRSYPPLPSPGECFRFHFLTHLEVVDDDPTVLADLLRAAYHRLRPLGGHYMAAMIPRGSKLEPAFSDFMVTRTPMTLYAVHRRNSRYDGRDFRTLHPGFEMALS
jgi:hypothetical protein